MQRVRHLVSPCSSIGWTWLYREERWFSSGRRGAPQWAKKSASRRRSRPVEREEALDALLEKKSDFLLETEDSKDPSLRGASLHHVTSVRPLSMEEEFGAVDQPTASESKERRLKSYSSTTKLTPHPSARAYLRDLSTRTSGEREPNVKEKKKGVTELDEDQKITVDLDDGETIRVKRTTKRNNIIVDKVLRSLHLDHAEDRSFGDSPHTSTTLEATKREKRLAKIEKQRKKKEKMKEKFDLRYGISKHPCQVQGGCPAHNRQLDRLCPHLALPSTVCMEGLESSRLHPERRCGGDSGGVDCYLSGLGLCPWHHDLPHGRNSGSKPLTDLADPTISYGEAGNIEESGGYGDYANFNNDYNAQVLFFESPSERNVTNTAITGTDGFMLPLLHDTLQCFIDLLVLLWDNPSIEETQEKRRRRDEFVSAARSGRYGDCLKLTQKELEYTSKEGNEDFSMLKVTLIPSYLPFTSSPAVLLLSVDAEMLENSVFSTHVREANKEPVLEDVEQMFSEVDPTVNDKEGIDEFPQDSLYEREVYMDNNRHTSKRSSHSRPLKAGEISKESITSVKSCLSTIWGSYLQEHHGAEEARVYTVSYLLTPFVFDSSVKVLTGEGGGNEEVEEDRIHLLKDASYFLFHQRYKNTKKFMQLYEKEELNDCGDDRWQWNHSRKLYLLRWAPLSFLKDLLLWKKIPLTEPHPAEVQSWPEGAEKETVSGNDSYSFTTLLEDILFRWLNAHRSEKKKDMDALKQSTQQCWNLFHSILTILTKSLFQMENLVSSFKLQQQITKAAAILSYSVKEEGVQNRNITAIEPLLTTAASSHTSQKLQLFSVCQVHLQDVAHLLGTFFQRWQERRVLGYYGWEPWTARRMFASSDHGKDGLTSFSSFGSVYYTASAYSRHHFPFFYFNFVNYALNSMLAIVCEEANHYFGIEDGDHDGAQNVMEKLLLNGTEEKELIERMNRGRGELKEREKYIQRYLRKSLRKRHKIMQIDLMSYTKVNLQFFSAIESLAIKSKNEHETLRNRFYALRSEYQQEHEQQKQYANNFRTRKYGDPHSRSEDVSSIEDNLIHPFDALMPHGTVAISPYVASLFLRLLFETRNYTYKSMKLLSQNIIKVNRLLRHTSKKEGPRIIQTEKTVHKRVFSKKLNRKVVIPVRVPVLKLLKDDGGGPQSPSKESRTTSLPYVYCLSESLVGILVQLIARMREKGEVLLEGLLGDLWNGQIVEFNPIELLQRNLNNPHNSSDVRNIDYRALLFPTSGSEIEFYLHYSHRSPEGRGEEEGDGVENPFHPPLLSYLLQLSGTLRPVSASSPTASLSPPEEGASTPKYAVRLAPTRAVVETLMTHTDFTENEEQGKEKLTRYHQYALVDGERFIYYTSFHPTPSPNRVSFASYLFLRHYHLLLHPSSRSNQSALDALLASYYYCVSQVEASGVEFDIRSSRNPMERRVSAEREYDTLLSSWKERINDRVRCIVQQQQKNDITNSGKTSNDRFSEMDKVKDLLKREESEQTGFSETDSSLLRRRQSKRLFEQLSRTDPALFLAESYALMRDHAAPTVSTEVTLQFFFELCLISLTALTERLTDAHYPNTSHGMLLRRLLPSTVRTGLLLSSARVSRPQGSTTANGDPRWIDAVVKSLLLGALSSAGVSSKNTETKASEGGTAFSSLLFSTFGFPQIFTLRTFLECQYMLYDKHRQSAGATSPLPAEDCFSELQAVLFPSTTNASPHPAPTAEAVQSENSLWKLYEGFVEVVEIEAGAEEKDSGSLSLREEWLSRSFLRPSVELFLWTTSHVYNKDSGENVRLLVAWIKGVLRNNEGEREENLSSLLNILRARENARSSRQKARHSKQTS